MSPKEREHAITKRHKAVFIVGIGCELGDGKKHDGRAPDYDDLQLRAWTVFPDWTATYYFGTNLYNEASNCLLWVSE